MGIFEKDKRAGGKIPVWLRVTIPTIASLVLFLIVIFAVHMPAVRDAMMSQRKASLKYMTQVVIGVLEHLRDQEKMGLLTREEARKKGIEIISLLRFGKEKKDYFWINDIDYKMVMHPYMPELEGKDLKKFADFKGKLLFNEMVDITKENGEGFVTYYWQWQDQSGKVAPKISYVRRFEPWGWVIGTGLYVEDLEADAEVRSKELIMLTLLVLGVIILLSAYTIIQSRRAGQQIQESETLFKGVFSHSRQFMGVLSSEGVLLMANKASLDFLGLDEENVKGKYFWETPWWNYSIEVQRRLKEIIQIGSLGGVGKGVFKHNVNGGKSIYVDFSVKPVTDSNGKVRFLIAEGHNITELKEAQEQIVISEAMFKGVFNQSLQFMGVVGLDGTLLEANKTSLDLKGVNAEDVVGKPFWEGPWWQSPASLRSVIKEDVRRAADGHVIRHEVKTVLPEGGVRYVDFSLKPTFGADKKILFLLAEGREITELRSVQDQLRVLNSDLEEKVQARTAELQNSIKRLENAQNQLIQSEKMAALGDLVAGVAHEINTPVGISVTSISYMEEKLKEIDAKIAKGELRKSDFDKFLSVAHEATKSSMLNLHRAAELIGNFKQVASDQASGQRRVINLGHYIDEILLSLRSKYKRTKHKINNSCPEELMINSYPGAFMQIFSNLIINSLIHGFEGIEVGNIDIGAEVDDDHVIIRYTDDGNGMTEADLGKIFEPFFTTKRGEGGTGLGMSIVYNLVTSRLGGTISCSSAKGEGTAFTILLPKEILVDT
ncbi:PAS/PAC sensor signal transduction histidine kinase [Maridesulfovibrio hydrothermalis AM13 = DSM 14728]|uniref:histidine kinase n=2 Tax=Maridesulfovibrio TaxID=2794998 RepID=L0R7H0_9BACT|nr:PAS/PAC sensor signal transduction histidine kinase [Maridesulfovibrio hydrothermalis AM13 = DSM 14728]